MLYTICNKFGEPKEDTPKVSSMDNKLTKVQDFGLQSRNGQPIGGYLLTIEGGVHYAILAGENNAPSTPSEPDTDEEIHVPADLEEPNDNNFPTVHVDPEVEIEPSSD